MFKPTSPTGPQRGKAARETWSGWARADVVPDSTHQDCLALRARLGRAGTSVAMQSRWASFGRKDDAWNISSTWSSPGQRATTAPARQTSSNVLGASGWEAVGLAPRSVAVPMAGMGAHAVPEMVVLLKRRLTS